MSVWLTNENGQNEYPDIGEVSDGYHTFNELYDHRIALFIVLMLSHPELSWRSEMHADGSKMEGWFIAGMHLPTGDITYHLPMKYFYSMPGIKILDQAPEWDGHTPDDVVKRLRDWRPNGLQRT